MSLVLLLFSYCTIVFFLFIIPVVNADEVLDYVIKGDKKQISSNVQTFYSMIEDSLESNEICVFEDYYEESLEVSNECRFIIVKNSSLLSINIGESEGEEEEKDSFGTTYVSIINTYVEGETNIRIKGSEPIIIEDSVFLGNVSIENEYGNIIMTNTIANTLKIFSIGGNVNVEYYNYPFSLVEGHLSTEYGSLTLYPKNLESQYRIISKDSDKDIKFIIQGVAENKHNIYIKTKYGHIAAKLYGIKKHKAKTFKSGKDIEVKDFDVVYIQTSDYYKGGDLNIGIDMDDITDGKARAVAMILSSYKDKNGYSIDDSFRTIEIDEIKGIETIKCSEEDPDIYSVCIAYLVIPSLPRYDSENGSDSPSLTVHSKNLFIRGGSTSSFDKVTISNVHWCDIDGLVANTMEITSAKTTICGLPSSIYLRNIFLYKYFNYKPEQYGTTLDAIFVMAETNMDCVINVDPGIYVNKLTKNIRQINGVLESLENINGMSFIIEPDKCIEYNEYNTEMTITDQGENGYVFIEYEGELDIQITSSHLSERVKKISGCIKNAIVLPPSSGLNWLDVRGGVSIINTNILDNLGIVNISEGYVYSRVLNASKLSCSLFNAKLFDIDLVEADVIYAEWKNPKKLRLIGNEIYFNSQDMHSGFLQPNYTYEYSSYYVDDENNMGNQTSYVRYIPDMPKSLESIIISGPYEYGNKKTMNTIIGDRINIGLQSIKEDSMGPEDDFTRYKLDDEFSTMLDLSVGIMSLSGILFSIALILVIVEIAVVQKY